MECLEAQEEDAVASPVGPVGSIGYATLCFQGTGRNNKTFGEDFRTQGLTTLVL